MTDLIFSIITIFAAAFIGGYTGAWAYAQSLKAKHWWEGKF